MIAGDLPIQSQYINIHAYMIIHVWVGTYMYYTVNLHLSIYLPIYLSTYLSIYLFIYLSTYLSIMVDPADPISQEVAPQLRHRIKGSP